MSYIMFMKCPVYMEEKDDICGEEIELELTREEKESWEYPGCPAEFEVVHALCGHDRKIEEQYVKEVWEHVRDQERSVLESRADADRDEKLHRKYYDKMFDDWQKM